MKRARKHKQNESADRHHTLITVFIFGTVLTVSLVLWWFSFRTTLSRTEDGNGVFGEIQKSFSETKGDVQESSSEIQEQLNSTAEED